MVAVALRARQIAGVVLAGAGLLAASCGNQPSATASARPRTCATAALRVGFGRQVSLYTSHVERSLVFTNRSGATCALDGYPAVSFVRAPGGRQVGAAADRIPAAAHRVVLAPGARARAALLFVNVLAFGSACSLSPAWGLRVYPPGQRAASYIALAGRVCSGPKPVVVSVGPVQHAAS